MICPKNECLECGACFAVCPINAIKMAENIYGEYLPLIDNDKCIKCNKCNKICPVINKTDYKKPLECYAAYTQNENDRNSCASGGIATAFGKQIINAGGETFGAVLNEKFSFTKAENISGLEEFKGSKYVHIPAYHIYRDIKKDLMTDKKILFIGTPCQCDALLHYIGKEYENLITVDLICHGTPPYRYLNEWIKYVTKGMYFDQITFRGKRDYYLTVYNDSKIIYSKQHNEDGYFSAFLTGLIHREPCYSCPYARIERISDITIGDFWGLPQNALNGYMGKKSVILINTTKGKNFFKTVVPNLVVEKRDITEAISGNKQLTHPASRDKKQKLFLRYYPEYGFYKALKKCGILRETLITIIKNKLMFFPRKIIRRLKNEKKQTG